MKLLTIHCLFFLFMPLLSYSSDIFLSKARVAELRKRVDAQVEPNFTAWQHVLAFADESVRFEPALPENLEWKVPGFYKDEEKHQDRKDGLRRDANAAYALALACHMTDDPRYAKAAVRLIMGWTTVQNFSPEDDSSLTLAYHYPPLIFAAALLRDTTIWTAENEVRFRAHLDLIVEQSRREEKDRWRIWDSVNNWGNWGNVLGMSAAVYLGDEMLFTEMIERWKFLVEESIADDWHLPHEVSRNSGSGTHGIWYTHFSLHPSTISAVIAGNQGTDLFGYVSPSGRSLRLAYERLVPWVVDLSSFPFYTGQDKSLLHMPYAISYWEILNSLWPNPEAEDLIKQERPLDTQHSSPYTTFTHGNLPADL